MVEPRVVVQEVEDSKFKASLDNMMIHCLKNEK